MLKTKRYTKIGVVLCFLIGIFIFMKKYNKPHVNVDKNVAHFQMSSSDLLTSFEIDETSANHNYLEKIIEVSGTVSGVDLEGTNAIVILAVENGIGSVQCHFKPIDKNKLKSLSVNEKVRIKGICTGYLMDVILVNSVLVN